MTAMRIAIASDWFTPRRGGVERQLMQLATRLAASGHEVEVLTSTPAAGEDAGAGVAVRRLGLWTLPKLDLVVSPALFHALHRELRRGYDVVHAHVSVVSPVGYTAAIVARALGLPVVVTFHSVLRMKQHLLRGVNALTRFTEGALVWTAVSELVARQARCALGDVELTVLPNGIDLGFWSSMSRSDASHDEAVTLVSTMRLQRKKRPRQLLRAFARATRDLRVRARLIVVGDGPARPAVERDIHALGLDAGTARAETVGWMDSESLRQVYGAADGFVLASTRESFGIAALEARAAGLPVIAMESSGSAEFLDHDRNALLCADDAALAASITRFLADGDLRSRLRTAATRLDRYDWRAVLSAHGAAYDRARTRAALAAGAAAAST